MRVLLIALLLAGCTTIGHQPSPSDWPRLSVTEHYVKVGVIWQQCYPTMPLWLKVLGGIPEGCAWLNMQNMTCDIYVSEGTPEGDRVLTHEREHCEGRDHLGSTQLADLWTGWKRAMTAGNATYCYVRHDGAANCVRSQ